MSEATTIVPGAERQLKNHTDLRLSVRNSLTMAHRGLLKMRRTPEQFFDVTLQPILFTLMFTYLFGGVVAGGLLVILFSWCLSWIFAFFGVLARTASSVQGMSLIILFPLTFLSNAFVPANTLPGWLQAFVKFTPLSHLISAVRQLANAGSVGHDFWLSLLGAVIVVLLFAPLTVRAYMRKA